MFSVPGRQVLAMSAAAAGSSPLPRSVLLLYRHILSAHRKLPVQHRELGDAYVQAEFRRHKGAAPEFLVPFERQWRDYLREVCSCGASGCLLLTDPAHGCARVQVISSAESQDLGRSLTMQELENLSEEQKLQVLKIAEETVKAAPDSK